MNAIVFANGTISDYDYISSKIDKNCLIVCADGGYRHAVKLNLKIDYLLGDMDSIDKDELKKISSDIKLVKYPAEKDDTDLNLAVKLCIEKKAEKITFIGCSGTRLDHVYGSFMIMLYAKNAGVDVEFIDKNNIMTIETTSFKRKAEIGQTISLLPFAGIARVANSKGLKYKIDDYTLQTDFPIGTSNVAIENEISLDVLSGNLLVFFSRD